MDTLETKKYEMTGNNSDLFENTMERIHSVSIKENKEKEDGFSTYSFETIFTNQEGYTFKLIAPKVRFKEYSMTADYDYNYTYGRYDSSPIILGSPCVDTNIALLLNVLPMVDKRMHELVDITDYHKMTLKEIEKELGYKIKLTEK